MDAMETRVVDAGHSFLKLSRHTPRRENTNMRDRERTLSIRVDDEELAKLHALAAHRDLPVSFLFRQWLGDHWRATFGDAPPPASRTKFGDAVTPTRKGAK
jgi:hypothetical protein